MNSTIKPQPSNSKSIPWYLLVVNLVLIAVAEIAIGLNSPTLVLGILAGVFGLLVVGLSIFRKRFAMYLLIVLLPLAEFLRVDWLPSTLLVIPGALIILSLLACILLKEKEIYIGSPILLMAALLGIWASVATLAVGSVWEARPYWLVIILLFLVPNLLTEVGHLLKALWLLLLPLGGLGLYVAFNRLSFFLAAQGISMDRLHLAPIGAGDKNVIGLWLTLGIPIVYYLYGYYDKESGKRFWLLLSGAALIAGIVATLSIGAFIGSAVMVVLIVWFQPDTISRLRNLVIGVLLLVIVISGPISERLQNQDLFTFDATWGTYRGELWRAGYLTILDHPLFGLGLQPARRSAMMPYINQWFIKDWHNRGILVVPHNIFLSVGVDIGLPGLASFLLLMSAVWLLLWKLKRQLANHENPLLRIFPQILLIALIGGWVQGLGLSEHLNKLLWFLMGCTVALNRIARAESGTEPAAVSPKNPELP